MLDTIHTSNTMIDHTKLFHAEIKTIRTRNRAFGNILSETNKKANSGELSPSLDKNEKMNKKDNSYVMSKDIDSKSKEIHKQIKKLQEFLNENKNVYLQNKSITILEDKINSINEKEKETIDIETQKIMKSIKTRIHEVSKLIDLNKTFYKEQFHEHCRNIVIYLDNYLKKVVNIYLNMKTKNEKTNEKYKNMLKLSNDKNVKTQSLNLDTKEQNKENFNNLPEKRLKYHERNKSETNVSVSFDNASFMEDIESHTLDESQYGELSPEEIQTFKNENDSLFKNLTCLNEEVEQIETKVLKVAELQQQLTENIYEQSQSVEKTLNAFVSTTENIKEGNEQLRQAIQGNATLRLFVILILLVLSFTLLFLDWYND